MASPYCCYFTDCALSNGDKNGRGGKGVTYTSNAQHTMCVHRALHRTVLLIHLSKRIRNNNNNIIRRPNEINNNKNGKPTIAKKSAHYISFSRLIFYCVVLPHLLISRDRVRVREREWKNKKNAFLCIVGFYAKLFIAHCDSILHVHRRLTEIETFFFCEDKHSQTKITDSLSRVQTYCIRLSLIQLRCWAIRTIYGGSFSIARYCSIIFRTHSLTQSSP